MSPQRPTPHTVDWDRAMAGLQKIFRDLDNADRRARDQARREKTVTVIEKVPPGRCQRCKRFSKENFCTRCAS